MRCCSLALFSLALLSSGAAGAWAQAPGASSTKPKPAAAAKTLTAESASSAAAKDLPVRKVVLYKNGVGYFEHAGTVTGTQKVSIDFTSSQLNDVLQSLTVLDEGGGRIGGVNYNSTTPLAEQLKSLSLGMTDDPNSIELFQALRGQRVEVSGAPGGVLTGRLMNIEQRTENATAANQSDETETARTTVKYYLTVVAATGAVRVIQLTPQLSVRPLEASLQGELNRYLELLSTTHETGLRHLTMNAIGQGPRELRVSYISEVPVWKSTYRLVFPKEMNGKATLQGWAVVDNTVGADWDNVKLSLVAGAPQSFIQPLSKPLYVHRPEVQIATEAQQAPQTHEAAEQAVNVQAEMLNSQQVRPKMSLAAPARIPRNIPMLSGKDAPVSSFGVAGMEGLGGASGGVYRASDAVSESDVATKSFDDFFEYALTQPVTIHKNESAMVPILQQELPAQHVTLWSEREPTPLRAVWLENASKLTLDKGSFSIFESGEFAGEGLLEPIHPGERRLLSYAADQAVRVRVGHREGDKTLHHVSIQKGTVLETRMDETAVTYVIANSADAERAVLIESPRRGGDWKLQGDLKADETTADVYRFKVPIAASSAKKIEVRQQGPERVSVQLTTGRDQRDYLLDLVKRAPESLAVLQPVIDAQAEIAKIDWAIAEQKHSEEAATADEARARENVTALKGNEAARRFVDTLNRAEDALEAARKRTAELTAQKQAAVEKLNKLISALSFDWDVKAAK